MPPKPKLYKPKVEKKPNTDSSPSNLLNEDVAQQFEAELYWCIKQLQNALESGKLNNKQGR